MMQNTGKHSKSKNQTHNKILLHQLKQITNNSALTRDILLGILLIDDKDNHEYFLHKYNVSNKLKETLQKFSKNLSVIVVNESLTKIVFKVIKDTGKSLGYLILEPNSFGSLNLIFDDIMEKDIRMIYSKKYQKITNCCNRIS